MRVLFVSKPIAPPWHDGSKNLVRDVAANLVHARPTVMTTADAPSIGERVAMDAVYRQPGRFAPGVAANARVMRRLLTGDPHDVWNFVFAPNAASSSAARVAIRARRTLGWRGAVVQTVASAPRDFRAAGPLLFGDVVVALSEWTRGRLLATGTQREAVVIPPCAADPGDVQDARIRAVRAAADLGDAPYVVYPGDYEISTGAETFAAAIGELSAAHPGAVFVFACRAKTPRSGAAKARLVDRLEAAGLGRVTRHLGEVADMAALVAGARAVAFPVDDLYGKVDVPLVLLEAAALGVPCVIARGGPLEALTAAIQTEPEDPAALASALSPFLDDSDGRARAATGGALRDVYNARFSPARVAAAYDALYQRLTSGSK